MYINVRMRVEYTWTSEIDLPTLPCLWVAVIIVCVKVQRLQKALEKSHQKLPLGEDQL